jgi:AraC family transcriptional regulator
MVQRITPTPSEFMTRLEGTALPVAPLTLKCGTQLTRPWARAAYHGYVPAMSGHLISTYHGRQQPCTWFLENKRLAARLRQGTITVLPESHDGHWDLNGPVEVSHLYLADERLQSCAAALRGNRRVELIPCVGMEDALAAHILTVISREVEVGRRPSTLFIDQAIELLCTQLIRAHTPPSPVRGPKRGGLTARQVQIVTHYMSDYLDQDITLSELAALVGLSRFHFCTAFRLSTGQTPYGWLTCHRIEHARGLLAKSALQITDIASAVGYATPSAFSASFRKLVGMTPSQFRRLL